MKVKILETATKSEITSQINLVTKNKSKLPSLNEGWRFNFSKHSRRKDCETYILTTDIAPKNIEGCLIIGYLRKLFFDVKMKKYVGKQGVMKEHSHS